MRHAVQRLTAACLLAASALAAPAAAAQVAVASPAELKHYNVTVRRFDPNQGFAGGTDFILPVDSPDEEHAAASTLANAISWSQKTRGMQALPVAFAVTRIALRR